MEKFFYDIKRLTGTKEVVYISKPIFHTEAEALVEARDLCDIWRKISEDEHVYTYDLHKCDVDPAEPTVELQIYKPSTAFAGKSFSEAFAGNTTSLTARDLQLTRTLEADSNYESALNDLELAVGDVVKVVVSGAADMTAALFYKDPDRLVPMDISWLA